LRSVLRLSRCRLSAFFCPCHRHRSALPSFPTRRSSDLRHRVDAGIFFSDIVVPARQAGLAVEIRPGVGPVFDHPVRTVADIDALPPLGEDYEAALDPIREAVALTVAELGTTPLIGFAGAPFTVASYMVEGGPSRDHLRTRALMRTEPEAFS